MTDDTQALAEARRAARRAAWREAHDLFSRLDPATLGADDLAAMADAAWWTCRLSASMALRRRAYAAYAAAGEPRRAAHEAWFLSADHRWEGEGAVAAGWLGRAERHLHGIPECREHGLVMLARAEEALGEGDSGRAGALAERALALAGGAGEPDVAAMALQLLGRARLAEGRDREGLALLDEAMCAVVAGELSPLFTGWVFCVVLTACIERADVKRAGEWSAEAVRWCGSLAWRSPFEGLCRIYRVEVTLLRGEWAQAEADAAQAVAELREGWPALAGAALCTLGELHRRRGRLAAAEDAYLEAHRLGRDPQPGLALVRLAQGRPAAAAAALRGATGAGASPLERGRLAAARLEVALATGDRHEARAAARALAELAGGGAALEAAAETAAAEVGLLDDDHGAALRAAGRAWALWQELGLPYEAARARVLTGRARRAAGDPEGARRELEAARAALTALGAAADARAVGDLLRGAGEQPGGLSPREVEVLRLVAAGRTNRQVAAELVLSEHTVARHLQNVFAKLGVSSRAAAAAHAVERRLV